LLTHMLAKEVGLQVGDFIHSIGDAHLYTNHLDQVRLQLSREPRALPTVSLAEEKTILGNPYEIDDVKFIGYDPHPGIKAPVAV